MKKIFPGSKNSCAGFSLIELLMVAFLIPFVGFAVYSNFNASVKIWQRLHQQTSLEDLNLFTQKTSNTFNTVLKYSSIPFEAEKDSVSFAALIVTMDKLGGDRGIGEVKLFYDEREQAIKKEEKNLSQLYREAPGKVDSLLVGVTDFKVSFFTFDKQDKAFKWIEEWTGMSKTEFPIAVRFEFKFTSPSSERMVKKTFLIPAGGTFESY